MTSFKLPPLPPKTELESASVLRTMATAHRYLAELKGLAETIPNQEILINTLSLQEAKDSSAIENIITTHDELYRQVVSPQKIVSGPAKEVKNYGQALKHGFNMVKKDKFISSRHILSIQALLENNDAGYRKVPGTKLINDSSKEVIYTPPQNQRDILTLMHNLEAYINDVDDDTDPLIKMAVIHYQFESIHPFYDGNGRTGRILNILYLVHMNLLTIPILYMSRYIIKNKAYYYTWLQAVRKNNDWETWLLFMLEGIKDSAQESIVVIKEIQKLFLDTKHLIRNKHAFYSHALMNCLFSHPYTKIEHIIHDLKISRITATRYLTLLVADGLLEKIKQGRSNYYINRRLFNILKNIESS